MTLGLPPSMMATQELVVPRSMPMIFAMFVSPRGRFFGPGGRSGCFSALSRVWCGRSLRHRDQGRAEHPVVQEVALLKHGDDRVGLLVRGHLADRLVAVRVEFLASRVDLADGELLEHRIELAGGDLHPLLERLDRGVLDGE